MTKPRAFDHANSNDQYSSLAIREIAEKARFGGFYYLFGLSGGVFTSPAQHFRSALFILLLIAFSFPLLIREFAYRQAKKSADRELGKLLRLFELCYMASAALWAAFTIYLLWWAGVLQGGAAATIGASAGFAAGGVTAIIPHTRLIRAYSF